MTGVLIGALIGAALAISTRKPEPKAIPIKVEKNKNKK